MRSSRELDREYSARWRKANPIKLKEYRRRAYDKDRATANRQYLWTIEQRAKRKNLEFDLKKDDLNIPDICPILGIKIKFGKEHPQGSSPSVDRIDNGKGYTKENIQVISNKANSMKQDATPEELIRFAEWVLKTYQR